MAFRLFLILFFYFFNFIYLVKSHREQRKRWRWIALDRILLAPDSPLIVDMHYD